MNWTAPSESSDGASPATFSGKVQELPAAAEARTIDSLSPLGPAVSASVVPGRIPGYVTVDPDTAPVTALAPDSDQPTDSPVPTVTSTRSEAAVAASAWANWPVVVMPALELGAKETPSEFAFSVSRPPDAASEVSIGTQPAAVR